LARTRRRGAGMAVDQGDSNRIQILHSIPGRIRIHIPDWQNLERSALEHRLRVMPGVAAVHANPLTRNLLIHFDPPDDGRERVLKLIDAVLRKCDESRQRDESLRGREAPVAIPTVSAGAAGSPCGLRPLAMTDEARPPLAVTAEAPATLRALTPTPRGLRPISVLRVSTKRVSTPKLLTHAPAILSLALSLLTVGSPLSWVRVAIETLQLCAELVPGQA
jgi:hypothetical protein